MADERKPWRNIKAVQFVAKDGRIFEIDMILEANIEELDVVIASGDADSIRSLRPGDIGRLSIPMERDGFEMTISYPSVVARETRGGGKFETSKVVFRRLPKDHVADPESPR